jgi:hypothetical protein
LQIADCDERTLKRSAPTVLQQVIGQQWKLRIGCPLGELKIAEPKNQRTEEPRTTGNEQQTTDDSKQRL